MLPEHWLGGAVPPQDTSGPKAGEFFLCLSFGSSDGGMDWLSGWDLDGTCKDKNMSVLYVLVDIESKAFFLF